MLKTNVLRKLINLFLWIFLASVIGMLGIYFYFHFTQETEPLDANARQKIGGKFMKLAKGYVHYELEGIDSANTIILIHGAGSGYYAWDKNFGFLVNNGYKTLRYDLYGRGFSDRPAVEYNPDLFEIQLEELIDSLKLRPPFTLVSVSMGAIIAVNYVLKHPEKVSSLVFIDPAALNDPQKPLSLKMPIVSDALMTMYWYPRAVEKQMKEFYNPSSVREYAEISKSQMKYRGFKYAMKSTWLNTLNRNLKAEILEIGKLKHIKTLLLWGKHDPLISPKASEHYLQVIPNIEYHIIDSAGHLANYENPESVNNYILTFLKK